MYLILLYQAWDALFCHQMKHQEESWKCDAQWKYFWWISRCFIWWWNTVSSAWYYFSNKMILEREIRTQKWAVFHLVSKHSLNINLLACFAAYTCRSSWQQTLLKVQSQFQTSNMVSAHYFYPTKLQLCYCMNRTLNIYRDKYFCKKKEIIVFTKSSL